MAGEILQRSIDDPDHVAHVVIDLDLALFDPQGGDLFLRQRSRLPIGADEARAAAGVAHHIPGIIGHHHFTST